jgi:hypothetical protein
MSGLKAETCTPAITMDGCQALANAIIAQAAKDYRAAIRQLKTHPDSQKAAVMKRECEKFFHSRWYGMLTGVDPNYILDRIREEEAA